jgi:hypothetical protein
VDADGGGVGDAEACERELLVAEGDLELFAADGFILGPEDDFVLLGCRYVFTVPACLD